jgi:Gas vesicle protein
LERALDKGIVIVGDIQIRLLDIELPTIKLRLVVASVDKAREMGINWWESDEYITGLEETLATKMSCVSLNQRLEALEGRINTSPQVESKRAAREEEARLPLVSQLTGHWLFGPLQQMCADVCTVF